MTYLTEEGMDAERLLQELLLLLRLRHQLLVETLQLLQTLRDVMRREVTTSDLQVNMMIVVNDFSSL